MLLNCTRLTIKGQRKKEACLRRMSQSPLEGTIGSLSSRYLSRRILQRNKRQQGHGRSNDLNNSRGRAMAFRSDVSPENQVLLKGNVCPAGSKGNLSRNTEGFLRRPLGKTSLRSSAKYATVSFTKLKLLLKWLHGDKLPVC